MTAPEQGEPKQPAYIKTAVGWASPPGPRPYKWARGDDVPRREELHDRGNAAEGLRRELVEFVAAAGLPITMEPATGFGSMGGAVATVKQLSAFLKLTRFVGSFLLRTRKNALTRRRRSYLPVIEVKVLMHDTTRVLEPFLALLPDLQRHLKEKRPGLRFYLQVSSVEGHVETTPEAEFSESSILKALALLSEGHQYIGIRGKSWNRWRSVRGFHLKQDDQKPRWNEEAWRDLHEFLDPSQKKVRKEAQSGA